MRELVWMYYGRGEFEWGMTSSVLAMIYNVNRASGRPLAHAEDWNPFLEKKTVVINLSKSDSMKALKDAFCKK